MRTALAESPTPSAANIHTPKIPKIFDFLLQIFFCFALFYRLTGLAFLLDWDSYFQLSLHRDLHLWILNGTTLAAAFLAWLRYRKDAVSFWELEPARTIRWFSNLPARISVSFLFACYASMQSLMMFFMHKGFQTYLWDMGFYDQVIWNTAHGNFMVTSVRGGLSIFVEHFKAILALLSPIYWFQNSTTPLFAVSSLIAASSIPLSYVISRKITGSKNASLILALAVFFYLPMKNAAIFLFHTSSYADAFLLLGFLCFVTNHPWWGIFSLSFAALCKENMILPIFGLGLFLLQERRRDGIKILGGALFLLTVILISDHHFHWPYHFMNKWAFYRHLWTPDLALWKNISEPNPLYFLFLVFAPFLFLSFYCRGWYGMLAPPLAFHLLCGMPGLRLITAHYTSGLNALVILSSLYGLSRLLKRKHELIVQIPSRFSTRIPISKSIGPILLLTSALFSGIPEIFTFELVLWEASFAPHQKIMKAARIVPASYSVMTTQRLAPHLAHRPHLFVFNEMFPHTPYWQKAQHPDLVIAGGGQMTEDEQKGVGGFVNQGYRKVFKMERFSVFEHPEIENPLPGSILQKWREIEKTEVIPYRKIARRFYKPFALACIILLVAMIGFRGWKERVKSPPFDAHHKGEKAPAPRYPAI